jgi:hypothetical protein
MPHGLLRPLAAMSYIHCDNSECGGGEITCQVAHVSGAALTARDAKSTSKATSRSLEVAIKVHNKQQQQL